MTDAPQELTRADKERLAVLLREQARREGRRTFYRLFPDETEELSPGVFIHARELYPKHMEHFAAGAIYLERCFRAANRVGKSVSGGYETSAHATGEYPDWWQGHRFDGATRSWVAGKTNETTRDIIQSKLFGQVVHEGSRKRFSGTGLIPGERIGEVTWKQGVPDFADTVKVKNNDGNWSVIGQKSYQQGRDAFEGTAQHFIWLDEECPLDIYGECLMRTMTTNGRIVLTFTPLEGMSEVVQQFMPEEDRLPDVDEPEEEWDE